MTTVESQRLYNRPFDCLTGIGAKLQVPPARRRCSHVAGPSTASTAADQGILPPLLGGDPGSQHFGAEKLPPSRE